MTTPKDRVTKCRKLAQRWNWRGNRPRMGKRGMCGACGCLINAKVEEGATCPQCGESTLTDVSYDDATGN